MSTHNHVKEKCNYLLPIAALPRLGYWKFGTFFSRRTTFRGYLLNNCRRTSIFIDQEENLSKRRPKKKRPGDLQIWKLPSPVAIIAQQYFSMAAYFLLPRMHRPDWRRREMLLPFIRKYTQITDIFLPFHNIRCIRFHSIKF